MIAEVIVLNDRPMIKVTNEHGHHMGFFATPAAIAAQGIDLADLTIKVPLGLRPVHPKQVASRAITVKEPQS